jgi:phage terminase Nu1 subunit (DNA packaging protein)
LKKRIDQLPDDAIPDLNESRARREHYQAELAKLEVDHRRSELVAADAVKKEAYSVAKTVREALINIPDRVANLLAAETDASAIHMALTEEITQALEGLVNA